MKKIKYALILAMMSLMCACKKEEQVVVTESTTEIMTELVTETVSEAETETEEETTMDEELKQEMTWILKELLEYNMYFNLMVFRYDTLPPLEIPNPDSEEHLYLVDTSMYHTYAEFEEFIRSVYVKETADELLYNYPSADEHLYIEKDGMLYLDTRYAVEKEYDIDWFNYELTIDYIEDKECGFTVEAEYYAENEKAAPEIYSVSSKIIWDDGNWYLEKMIY